MNNRLYGTTNVGGTTGCFADGCGTVYEVTHADTEHVLYRFAGATDGFQPNALTELNGTLYGTTSEGGTTGWGTVFRLTP